MAVDTLRLKKERGRLKMALQEDLEIGKNYADTGMKATDLPGASVGSAKAKPSSAAGASEPNDKDLLAAIKARKEGDRLFAESKISWDEHAALGTRETNARRAYSDQRDAWAIGQPRVSPLPKLGSELGALKLERDDVGKILRDTKKEERTLLDKAATSHSAEARGLANIGLKQLHDEADPKSIPAITKRLDQVDERVQKVEERIRNERMRQGN